MGRNNAFEENDYYPSPRRSAPEFEDDLRRRVVTRSPPRREERGVSFLREERRNEAAGPVVLRSREVETIDRHRRSPSPRYAEEMVVRRPRSMSSHTHEHERTKSRTRYVEKERVRKASPSPSPPKPQMVRYVERRPRSPSPVQRERIRIVDKRREESSSSSSSSSEDEAPAKIRAPTIEREVITHYRGIDHGVVKVKPPSPVPLPRRKSFVRERETDIDISLSKNRTAVDVVRRDRNRSRSRERRSGQDELVVYKEKTRPRAHSAGPLHTPIDEEGEFLSAKIDSRGRMGEAWHGATKDWSIVDVPPGTERVRMDGVGGGSTDTKWSKYSGVRRTQFIPERDGDPAPRRPSPEKEKDKGWDREREIDIERTVDRQITRAKTPQPKREMWTEISKDLVSRRAIEYMGYEYEDTPGFFYIMDYLKYDDVLQLTELTEDIRRHREDRVREIEWERESRHQHHHQHHSQHYNHHPWDQWDDEHIREREIIYENGRPVREYIR